MFVSTDSIAVLWLSLAAGKAEPLSTTELSSKRAASVSTAALLGLTACKALQSCSWVVRGFGLLALVELGFYLWQRHRYTAVNAVVEVPLDRVAVRKATQRFVGLHNVFELRDFLEGWFFGAPFESIKRGNVLDLVAYGFYTRRLDQLTQEDRQNVEQLIGECEQRWDVQLPAGHTPDLPYMAHLLEPLRVVHHPLCLHLASEAAHAAAHAVLRARGFRSFWSKGFRCWVLEANEPDNAQEAREQTPPIVFIHGVGLGVLPYLHMLRKLGRACPRSQVILLELPAVSLRLNQRAADVDAIADAAVAAASQHARLPACFVAHSFGTFCVARIVQLHPTAIHSMVLMDPVCMLTCFPQLLHNFVYQMPSLAGCFSSIKGLANNIRCLIARDMIIAETFCRKFVWHQLMLWPEDMPPRSVIAIAAQDDLVPCPLVAAQLRAANSHATLMVHPTASHGGILFDPAFQRELLEQTVAAVHDRPAPPVGAFAAPPATLLSHPAMSEELSQRLSVELQEPLREAQQAPSLQLHQAQQAQQAQASAWGHTLHPSAPAPVAARTRSRRGSLALN